LEEEDEDNDSLIPDAVPLDQEQDNDSDNDSLIPDAIPLDTSLPSPSLQNDCLEMIVVREIKAGQEVFNTYGQHSNSSLLRLYGFVEEGNPYSYVNMNTEEIIQVLDGGGCGDVAERVAFWDQVERDVVEELEEISKGYEEVEGMKQGHEYEEEEEDDEEEENKMMMKVPVVVKRKKMKNLSKMISVLKRMDVLVLHCTPLLISCSCRMNSLNRLLH
jgi:hypothetical protein